MKPISFWFGCCFSVVKISAAMTCSLVQWHIHVPKSLIPLCTRRSLMTRIGRHHHTRKWIIFTVYGASTLLPAATKLGQGNICTGVCLSTGGGEGCLPQCMLGYTPPGADPPPRSRHPPWSRQTPPEQTPTPPDQADPLGADPLRPGRPPPPRSRLQHTVNERPVRILLECILVSWCFTLKTTAL